METLPNELLHQILQHLPLPSLKCMRQTSKLYSTLGQPYLLSPTFLALPHRPSTQHLRGISHHAFFAPLIKSIHFNHGEVNEYSGRHNSYFLQYLMEPEERLTQQHVTWEAYASFKRLTDQHLPDSCDEDILTDIFSHLPNLNSVKISLMTCPFPPPSQDPDAQTVTPDLLPDIWAFPSTRLLPRVATVERMTSVTNAISTNISSLTIKTLSHDRLPFEFFFQKPAKISVISQAFTNLTSLTLHIDYSDLPNDTHSTVTFSNLAKCLRTASNLQNLSLAFQGRKKIDIKPLLENFAEDGFTFQGLEEVQLQGMITTEDDLFAFLARHSKSLKDVTLGGPGVRAKRQPVNGGVFLEAGSWSGLVGRLRGEMCWEGDGKGGDCRVYMWGDCKELVGGGKWVIEERMEAGRFLFPT